MGYRGLGLGLGLVSRDSNSGDSGHPKRNGATSRVIFADHKWCFDGCSDKV